MYSRPESEEAVIRRLLPSSNADRADRDAAWAEWLPGAEEAIFRFVRAHNNTAEPDDDLVQDALITAYLGVERGSYQPREGVPFSAYVKGIARNKIREARRRYRQMIDLDEIPFKRDGALPRQPEEWLERREEVSSVRSGLEELPAARKQVLVRFLNGDSTERIAEHLGVSEELVRQHKCRGLKMLKALAQQTGGRYASYAA